MKRGFMHILSTSFVRKLSLGSLICSTAFSANVQPTSATAETPKQTEEVAKATASLKTKIPSASERRPPRYIIEVEKSQSLKPISLQPVQPVPITLEAAPTGRVKIVNDDAFVPLFRPPLQALISVQEDLNPFSIDAAYAEHVGLPDVLNYAMAQNLSIENSYDGLKIQKFRYLSATSKFLPDLTSGYTFYGLHGSIPSSIFSNSSSSAGSTGAGFGGSSSASSTLPGHIQVLSAGFTYHAYQGGKILFSSLEQKHRLRASRAGLKGSVNDVLLDSCKRYYDLVLNEALLEIRSRAVEISTEQVRLNSVQERAGTATGLDVLQSQAQLASDQQNLVDQQSTRRQSAIKLATILNGSFAQDLSSSETSLKKRRIVPRNITVGRLLYLAIENRPELKQYEELRLAAKRAIGEAQAPLHPVVNLGGSVYGIDSANSSATSIFLLSLSVNWTLGALGTTDLANIAQAKWQARQSAVQAKEQFQNVFQQVRTAYVQSLAADRKIEAASAQIISAEEELRIAKKRMEAGIGLNIDVLNAQRDRTQAAINKSQAIVDFNTAQVQLLHDMGLISVDSVNNGMKI
jgi:outer membrane protein TolC